jgi:hypothetical protein
MTSEVETVQSVIEHRGIVRLCHFTRLNSLTKMIEEGAILSRVALEERGSAYFPNDPDRYDGHKELISATIQYPNVHTLRGFRTSYGPAIAWAVMCLDPNVMVKSGTLFCPCNAATHNGAHMAPGVVGLTRLFDSTTPGFNYPRGTTHLGSCPTNMQAEVLVPGPIEIGSCRGIVVENGEHQLQVRAMLLQANIEIPVAVQKNFFDVDVLRDSIQNGRVVRVGDVE